MHQASFLIPEGRDLMSATEQSEGGHCDEHQSRGIKTMRCRESKPRPRASGEPSKCQGWDLNFGLAGLQVSRSETLVIGTITVKDILLFLIFIFP